MRIELSAALAELGRVEAAVEETSIAVSDLVRRDKFELAREACDAALGWAPEDAGIRWQRTQCLVDRHPKFYHCPGLATGIYHSSSRAPLLPRHLRYGSTCFNYD